MRGLLTLGIATLVMPLMGIQSASAELPALTEKPWMGQFAVFKNRAYQIVIGNQGEMHLSPLNKRGDVIGAYISIPITIGVVERLPNGISRPLAILPETLESSDSATDRLEKAVIRGQVTGGASFEATIEVDRDIVSIGGRVTDPGPTPKNPLAFAVLAKVPYFFGHVKKDTAAQRKAFEATIKDDYIEVKWTDRKRHRELLVNSVDAASPAMTGPGIAAAEMGLTPFQGKKFLLSASGNSMMKLANAGSRKNPSGSNPAPLYEGFLIHWTPDQDKDPQGLARLTLQVK